MTAIEFVKKFGLERGKQVLRAANGYDSFRASDISATVIYGSKDGYTPVKDLKQIVEAFELVKKRGGLAEAKAIEQQYWNSGVGSAMIVFMELKQAIELVESVK